MGKAGELTLASEAIEASLQGSKLLFGGTPFLPASHNQPDEAVYRRGLARNVMLALDFGESITLADPAPSRLAWMLSAVKAFIREFFDANPLSQLGIVASRDSQAFRVSPLSSNPEQHIRALEEMAEPSGSVSVQNTLQLCVVQLRHVPAHATREIVFVWSALTSCDPGDLEAEIQTTQSAGVRCSMLHLGASVFVLQRLVRLTGGEYACPLTAAHGRELLAMHVRPPLDARDPSAPVALVTTGFPLALSSALPCACHGQPGRFTCPKCSSVACALPSTCHVCALPLVSSSHLARSYRHLFPVPSFTSQSVSQPCAACQIQLLPISSAYSCPKCDSVYCIDCDQLMHQVLFNCVHCCAPVNARK